MIGKDLIYEPNASDIRKITDGLAVDGLNGDANTGFAIVAIKDSKFGANDYIKSLETYPLAIRPVVAGAKVLNADVTIFSSSTTTIFPVFIFLS